ncbi:hypothetical protein ACHHYP_15423 [Achlya hypogyna]|uniref:Uncharacterized protein n=1 Tax=Achlya hypogyna TaxID=1202772 RepID=A0A1V9ZF72_ACHHY|nr:hypothetical protein ACHHYP_15423 [Achlya hypogyna]
MAGLTQRFLCTWLDLLESTRNAIATFEVCTVITHRGLSHEQAASLSVLTSIKAAEVVNRGYLVDTLLPPIARLEANRTTATKDMRCVHLRRVLRGVFAHVQDPSQRIELAPSESSAPSLLLLALGNQFKAAMAFLEEAVTEYQKMAATPEGLVVSEAGLTQTHATVVAMTELLERHAQFDTATDSTPEPTVPAPRLGLRAQRHWEHAHRLKVAMDSASAVLYSYKHDLVHGEDETTAHDSAMARVTKLLEDVNTEWAREPQIDEDGVTHVFVALSTGRPDADDATPVLQDDGAALRTFNFVVDELQGVLEQRVLPPERVNGDDVEAPVVVAPPVPKAIPRPALRLPSLHLELQSAFRSAPNDYVLGSSDDDDDADDV